MSRSTLPLAFGVVALLVAAAGLIGPPLLEVVQSDPPAVTPAAPVVFEFVLFGSSLDDQHLSADAAPLFVYRVPAGEELHLTDVDATAGGLVVWRRTQQRLEQVGFVIDRGAVGLGQSSRSYATGIPFGSGDELLVQAAGGDVEWAVLRGVVGPVGATVSSP